MSSIRNYLDNLKKDNRLREIPDMASGKFLDLSSNDYLSLAARHPDFMEEFLDRFGDAAFSSSSSRLLSSNQSLHLRLEDFLASLYGKPTLLFNSGYHANVGCIGALTLPGILFVCDKLVHASVIDGLHISGSEFKRFPHNDIDKLSRILEKETGQHERIVVVVESIYSMDGDEAPLQQLVALKKRYPEMLLYVDEAHAFGLRGERGLGCSEQHRLISDIDIIIGTFGKAAASVGAFAATSEEIKSLLVNCARPFIFSTALPPVNIAWSMLMIEKIIGMTAERENLQRISSFFRNRLSEISGKENCSSSQIVPYLTGDAAAALSIAGKLKESGIIALPIRRPTVPPGGERIRFSLCAGMDESQLTPVFNVLENGL